MKRILQYFLRKLGYAKIPPKKQTNANIFPDILDKEFWEVYNFCKPYTKTSVERMYNLFCSVKYILSKNLEGDFVERGVWRGEAQC